MSVHSVRFASPGIGVRVERRRIAGVRWKLEGANVQGLVIERSKIRVGGKTEQNNISRYARENDKTYVIHKQARTGPSGYRDDPDGVRLGSERASVFSGSRVRIPYVGVAQRSLVSTAPGSRLCS